MPDDKTPSVVTVSRLFDSIKCNTREINYSNCVPEGWLGVGGEMTRARARIKPFETRTRVHYTTAVKPMIIIILTKRFVPLLRNLSHRQVPIYSVMQDSNYSCSTASASSHHRVFDSSRVLTTCNNNSNV